MSPRTEVRETVTRKGRGVFTLDAIVAGTLVEESHMAVGYMGKGCDALSLYTFNWSSLINKGSSSIHQHAMALGNGSLYNHARPPNMTYAVDQAKRTMRFVATRDIEAGEELTIDYRACAGGPREDDDKFFARYGIPPGQVQDAPKAD